MSRLMYKMTSQQSITAVNGERCSEFKNVLITSIYLTVESWFDDRQSTITTTLPR